MILSATRRLLSSLVRVAVHAAQLSLLTDPLEDEKVSLDELQETIAEFEDYVQSSDVAAMQSMSLTVVFLSIESLAEL